MFTCASKNKTKMYRFISFIAALCKGNVALQIQAKAL
jgi:hypothetical protein